MSTVNDLTHDHIGNGIDDLGNNGKNNQERAAPKAAQLQNVCVVNIQIGCQHRIE